MNRGLVQRDCDCARADQERSDAFAPGEFFAKEEGTQKNYKGNTQLVDRRDTSGGTDLQSMKVAQPGESRG